MKEKVDFLKKIGFTIIIFTSVYKSLIFFLCTSAILWLIYKDDYYLGMLVAFAAVSILRFFEIYRDSEVAIKAIESDEFKEFEKHFHDDGEGNSK